MRLIDADIRPATAASSKSLPSSLTHNSEAIAFLLSFYRTLLLFSPLLLAYLNTIDDATFRDEPSACSITTTTSTSSSCNNLNTSIPSQNTSFASSDELTTSTHPLRVSIASPGQRLTSLVTTVQHEMAPLDPPNNLSSQHSPPTLSKALSSISYLTISTRLSVNLLIRALMAVAFRLLWSNDWAPTLLPTPSFGNSTQHGRPNSSSSSATYIPSEMDGLIHSSTSSFNLSKTAARLKPAVTALLSHLR